MATYEEIYALRYGTPWLAQRAEVAVVLMAGKILAESPDVPDHALRLEWARWAAKSSGAAASPFLWPLANDPDIQAEGEDVPDAKIDVTIERVLPLVIEDFGANPPIGAGPRGAMSAMPMPPVMPPPMPAATQRMPPPPPAPSMQRNKPPTPLPQMPPKPPMPERR